MAIFKIEISDKDIMEFGKEYIESFIQKQINNFRMKTSRLSFNNNKSNRTREKTKIKMKE